MNITTEDALTFDDVTMLPNYSKIKSRTEPSVSVKQSRLDLEIPIIAAPMNTVCEDKMAFALTAMGGQAVVHRYMSIDDQVSLARKNKNFFNSFWAIGASGDYIERAQALSKEGVWRFCIDVASGHSDHCLDATRKIKWEFPGSILMTGNVCTIDGFKDLANAGSDLIRVGVGSGAMCKTRIVTGHGVPQLTALHFAREAKRQLKSNVGIISDGGIRSSGDIVKALALADYVMLGSLLAGTYEAPGAIIKENGEEYKLYAGMASEDGRSLNAWFDREKTAFVPEGESVRLKYKGHVLDVVNELIGGLKVGMSYSGALNLEELKEKARFMRVTQSGQIEGTPHGKK
jgi:IMP dehydrogenase